MTDLSAIYNLEAPYRLRVVPVGKPVEITVLDKNKKTRVSTKTVSKFIPFEYLNHSMLHLPVLEPGDYSGTITVLADDFYDVNHKMYESRFACFDTPRQMVGAYIHRDCKHLTFYKDEVIECSSRHVLIEAIAGLIDNGIFIKELVINDVVFDIGNARVRTGFGYNATPLVTPAGIVRRTVRLDGGHSTSEPPVFAVRRDIVPQHYLQRMVLLGDFLLVDENPIKNEPLDCCPACGSSLIDVEDEWNCSSSDCFPFLEAFLNSIARQTGIAVDTLRNQYRREEKFHYSCDSTIEEQAREEIPVDILRTYYDVLGVNNLQGIMERFFGTYNKQLYCSKASAIDEMFYKHLTYGNATNTKQNRPVVYFPPRNDKPSVILIGKFDGASEQTLEMRLADMDITVSAVVQESDIVIAGEIGCEEEFYEYVKEVSNILILETGGKLHEVYDLMKKF